jgi:hypothetical protein
MITKYSLKENEQIFKVFKIDWFIRVVDLTPHDNAWKTRVGLDAYTSASSAHITDSMVARLGQPIYLFIYYVYMNSLYKLF